MTSLTMDLSEEEIMRDAVECPDAGEARCGNSFSLARDYGTPCYVYDEAIAESQVSRLKGILAVSPGEGVELFYSFKANPNPALAAVMARSACRADLTSPGEIAAARQAGFDLSAALYGGPGKTVSEWGEAIEAGIRTFSVESRHDLRALALAGRNAGIGLEALLRVNPDRAPKARVAMAGVASQFGFEESELVAKAGEIRNEAGGVTFRGLHIYWGTQIGDAAALLESFEESLGIFERLSERMELPFDILNLGGGFPWPYATRGAGPDLSPLQEGLERLRASRDQRVAWWFESGRFLSAPAGTLVAQVMEIKRSKENRRFLILDAGIHHLGGMAGLGRIPRFQIDLELPPERRGGERVTVDVVGPLCTPLDCIGRRVAVPELQRGDLVAIPNAGAYGVTASVVGFLSRRPPLEILHRNGEVVSVDRLRSGHETVEVAAPG